MGDELEYLIRPAAKGDSREIRRLIYTTRLNPMSLDWRRFLVAVDPAGRMLGCGQVKPHGDGTHELASIAVWPDYRGCGIASAVIQRLIAENPPPLYLTCRARLGSFYERFGFRVLDPSELPPYFQRIKRIVSLLNRFIHTEELLVMVRDQQIASQSPPPIGNRGK